MGALSHTIGVSMDVIREHDFYGAVIQSAIVGPRRELRLFVETWPKGGHKSGGGPVVSIRFGAIENFAEVQKFARDVPQNSLHYLRHAHGSKPTRNVIEMEFDGTGERFTIIAGHLSPLNTSTSV